MQGKGNASNDALASSALSVYQKDGTWLGPQLPGSILMHDKAGEPSSYWINPPIDDETWTRHISKERNAADTQQQQQKSS